MESEKREKQAMRENEREWSHRDRERLEPQT